jgi:hypothetical protein
MNRIEEIIALRDMLAYSMLYGPSDYPAEDRTNWEEQSILIQNQFTLVRNVAANKDDERWLGLALDSFRTATEKVTLDEPGEARRFLQEAEHYVGNAHAGKSSAVAFIAGPTGIETKETANQASQVTARKLAEPER